MPKPTRMPPPRVAIVASRYNATITDRLLDGARAAFAGSGHAPEALTILDAPGSFELTALSLAAARTGRFDGVLALGCIIKGETSHDQHLAQAVAQGLTSVTIATGVPVSFGVLTVDNVRQARDRAGGAHGNKGEQAMHALLHTITQIRALSSSVSRPHASTPSRPFPLAFPDKAANRPARPRKPR
jgi:6,7-dimethyl-8-ribityllumazine synthase